MSTISSMQGDAFVGISHFFMVDGGFGDNFTTSGKTVTEVPVAQDGGFTYTGGTPSVDHYKVHGISGDWTSRMTPGDTEINIFIPVVNSETLTACGFSPKTVSTGPTVADGDDGDYKFTGSSGYTFAETQKAIVKGLAAVNDDGSKMFAIKKTKLYASIVFDSADTAKPIGISLTGATQAASSIDAMGIFEGATSVVTQ